MAAQIVWDKAQELNVTFSDPKIEEALKAYMGIKEQEAEHEKITMRLCCCPAVYSEWMQ